MGRKEAVETDHGDHQLDEEVAEVVHTEKDIVLPRSNKQRRSMRSKRKKKKTMLRKSKVRMKSMLRTTTKKEAMKKSRPHKMMWRRSLRRQRARR